MPPDQLPTLEDVIADLEKKNANELPAKPEVKHAQSNDKTFSEPKQDPIETLAADIETAAQDDDGAPVEIEEPVVEDPPVVEKKAEKRDPQATRFAQLARREREARRQAQEAQQKAADVDRREKEWTQREAQLKALKNPLDILKAHGMSYADATQALITGEFKPKDPDPLDQKLDERLKPITESQSKVEKLQEDLNKALADINQYRIEVSQREVRQQMESAAKENNCEFIMKMGDEGYGMVQSVIAEYYRKHKKLLPISIACDRVESYYSDRFEKLASVSKVQSRFASSGTKAPTTPSKASAAKESPKTLTSSLSASARAKINIDSLDRNSALAHLAPMLKYIDN